MKNLTGTLFLLLVLAACSTDSPVMPRQDLDQRIALDFRKNEQQIRKELSRFFPVLTDSQMRAWESDGRLEMRLLNGEKAYFRYAVNNLFRIDSEARKVRDSLIPPSEDPLDSIRLENTGNILNRHISGTPAEKLRITFEFKVTVDADATPDGETIRCWLPFPADAAPRQTAVTLLESSQGFVKKSRSGAVHSSLYYELRAKHGEPTTFSYRASFNIAGQWFDPSILLSGNTSPIPKDLRKFTGEIPPQLIFSDRVRHLADSLTGNETNPYRIIRNFYYWIDGHIPWASALEYSIMDSIPDYVLKYRHGDCGMVTFLMLSMARYKGIPARWQSGWMLHPGEENLHDWCELWFRETGWIPLDMSFGLQNIENSALKEFYITGIDSYRLIINDGFTGSFDPPKRFFRSEPYDFQRGEIEWKGGNLYFNQWDYQLNVVSIEKLD